MLTSVVNSGTENTREPDSRTGETFTPSAADISLEILYFDSEISSKLHKCVNLAYYFKDIYYENQIQILLNHENCLVKAVK
jgi:hypothetical protein